MNDARVARSAEQTSDLLGRRRRGRGYQIGHVSRLGAPDLSDRTKLPVRGFRMGTVTFAQYIFRGCRARDISFGWAKWPPPITLFEAGEGKVQRSMLILTFANSYPRNGTNHMLMPSPKNRSAGRVYLREIKKNYFCQKKKVSKFFLTFSEMEIF